MIDDVNYEDWLRPNMPLTWSGQDAEQFKARFQSERPSVPEWLVQSLWTYWRVRSPNKPLFSKAEDNVALLLHAQAYGEIISHAGADNLFGEILQEHQDLYAPLTTPRLDWGPRAILSKEITAGLDSPVMHAWVFLDYDTMPKEILIIGEGLPEIRHQVLSAAFMTSLRVNSDGGGASDRMNAGALLITMPGVDQTPLDLPFTIIGDRRQPLAGDAAKTAQAVIGEFLSRLEELKQDTGLVQIHKVQLDARDALYKQSKEYAQEAAAGPVILWAPDEVSNKENGTDPHTKLVSLIPYWQIRDGQILSLTLSGDLLRTQAWERLLIAYHLATVERILADVRTRRVFYEGRANSLEAEKKAWDELEEDPAQRLARWGPTMRLNHKFDIQLGVTITLSQPEEVPTEKWFEEEVPHLIEGYRRWQERMMRIENSIEKAITRNDAPVRHFAVSRFLDAVVRGRTPDEGEIVQSAVKAWQRQIQPLLWFEWRSLLKKRGIEAKHIFTPHTLFHTWLSSTDVESHIDKLRMQPFTLFDRSCSVATFDSNNQVMVVYDATDYTERTVPTAEPVDQLWGRLETIAQQTDTDQGVFTEALRRALQQNPHELSQLILEKLIKVDGGISRNAPPVRQQELAEVLEEAKRKSTLLRTFDRVLRVIQVEAYQTARKDLAMAEAALHDPGIDLTASDMKMELRIHLLRAIVECWADGRRIQEEFPRWVQGYQVPDAVGLALERAREADENYVSAWIGRLEQWGHQVIKELLRDLPRARDHCSTAEFAALLAKQAAEAARLARELKETTVTLSEERETLTTALAKLGWALDSALLAEFSGIPETQLIDLLEALSGRQMIVYGGSSNGR